MKVHHLNFSNISFPPSSSIGSSYAIPKPFFLIFLILLIIYILVICLASLGSLIVIIVVLRAKHLRTQGNCHVINLAISDLLLVLVACPLTLAQVSSRYWPFPSILALCPLATFLPLLFSFASAFSICLNALDRHRLIVYHTSESKHLPTFGYQRASLLHGGLGLPGGKVVKQLFISLQQILLQPHSSLCSVSTSLSHSSACTFEDLQEIDIFTNLGMLKMSRTGGRDKSEGFSFC
jgi:hypothetical protein